MQVEWIEIVACRVQKPREVSVARFATVEDLFALFQRLPSNDKRFTALPGLAHVATLGVNRHLLWNATVEFFQAKRS